MINLFKPYTSIRSYINVFRVLLSGKLAEGKEVTLFESEFSDRFKVPNVLALNSGSSALCLAYELAGITENDEVIVPVLTCTATNIPLLHLKAKIVFADTDYDLNINIEDVIKKITPKTKAIVFVHFGGNNRGLRELLAICKDRGIKLIEDAAQAIGSDYWGKADFTCVSLQAIKILNSGDGGFLITKSKEDYEKAKRLRWFGYDREEKQRKGDTDIKEAGYKYHMNNISAAIGRGNLRSIDKVINHRKKLAEILDEGFDCHAWLAVGMTDDYEREKAMYTKHGIEIGQHHFRNDKYSVFAKFKNDCPIMDEIEHEYFFVPYHHGVSLRQANKILNAY